MKELYADGDENEVCVERSVRLETRNSFTLTGIKTRFMWRDLSIRKRERALR